MFWVILIVGLVIAFIAWVLLRNGGEVLAVFLKRPGHEAKLKTAKTPQASTKSDKRKLKNKPAAAPAVKTAPLRQHPQPASNREQHTNPSSAANNDSGVRAATDSHRAASPNRRARSVDRSDDPLVEYLKPPPVSRRTGVGGGRRTEPESDLIGRYPGLLGSIGRRGVGGGADDSNSTWRGTVGAGKPLSVQERALRLERNLKKLQRAEDSKRLVAPPPPAERSQPKRTTRHVSKSEKLRLARKLTLADDHSSAFSNAGESSTSRPKSRARRDAVDCSVFAPSRVPLNAAFLVQAFVHRPPQSKKVKALATEFDPDSSMRGFKSLGLEIERGTKLTLHLAAPGLEVDEPVQDVVWHGSPEAVQFAVTVPRSHAGGDIISTLGASLNGIPLGHIKFKVTIESGGGASDFSELKPSGISARQYRKAFISYSSADRNEVLKRVQMLSGLGITFFQDVLDLEPGSRWEKEIQKHIDECDLFLLFWSNASRQSTEVMKEIEYALQRKHDDLDPPEILPIPIEGPPPVPPPERLKHLHFNDYFLYFMR